MEIKVEFPDEGVTADVSVSPLGDNRYRLDEGLPLVESVSIYDIIKLEPLPNGVLRFQGVVEQSRWRTHSFAVSKTATESNRLGAILNRVEQSGGQWERVLGGLLFIHLPPGSEYDPTPDIAALSG